MKKLKLIVVISTALMGFFTCAEAAAQAAPPVKVTAWGMHRGGGVIYKYQVQNFGTNSIKRLFIGYYPPTSAADGAAELTVEPYYPGSDSLWLPPSVSQSPTGWGVYLSFPEESATFTLAWVEAGYYKGMWPGAQELGIPISQNPPNVMPPGASWDQFSVTLPKPDYAYVQGHANLETGDGEFTVPMVKGDSLAPTLKLEVEKVRKEGEFLALQIEVEVKDNYDPQPDVILESVTANHPLSSGDVKADIGKDSRKISVRNVAGRIYQISYAAIDASGNKTLGTVSYKSGSAGSKDKEDKEKAPARR